MFKLKKVDTFKTRVNVNRATDNPEKPEAGSFIAEFRSLSRSQLSDLRESVSSDADIVDHVLVDVEGVGDADGEPMAFELVKAAILDDIALSAAVVRAYLTAVAGAPEKNARPSRGR